MVKERTVDPCGLQQQSKHTGFHSSQPKTGIGDGENGERAYPVLTVQAGGGGVTLWGTFFFLAHIRLPV